jgi:hypothetical protein
VLDFPDSPTVGQIYNTTWKWDGTKWVAVVAAGGGGASITVSDTPPASPSAGNMWWDSLGSQLYLYYQDPTSNQWVAASSSGGSGGVNEAPTDGRLYARQGSTASWLAAQAAGAEASGILPVSFAVSASAGALTIALKDVNGNDPGPANPVIINFRDPNALTSALTPLVITAPLSITIPSGGTLGLPASIAFRIWIVLFNDGGTPRLGVVNCLNFLAGVFQIWQLYETEPQNSTAVSSSSTGWGVYYTGVAVTAKSFRILGFAEWLSGGLATAGTWTTTNLGKVRTFGPGVKKPGDHVNTSNSYTNSTGSSSSSAYVTVLNTSISQQSAANLIWFSCGGQTYANPGSSTSNSDGQVRLLRDAAALPNYTPYCGFGIASSSGQATGAYGTVNLTGYDFTNSAASHTYAVQVAQIGGAAATAQLSYVSTVLAEIMT